MENISDKQFEALIRLSTEAASFLNNPKNANTDGRGDLVMATLKTLKMSLKSRKRSLATNHPDNTKAVIYDPARHCNNKNIKVEVFNTRSKKTATSSLYRVEEVKGVKFLSVILKALKGRGDKPLSCQVKGTNQILTFTVRTGYEVRLDIDAEVDFANP